MQTQQCGKILYAGIIIAIAGILLSFLIVSLLNPPTEEITEPVTIIFVDESGKCIVETLDHHFLPVATPCQSEIGNTITVTYDELAKMLTATIEK